jgi:MYXO-CTERM domain-containing protein
MRPVRVTTPGASLALPLRMVSAGTGANVGITLWVVGEGRYEPIDFPWFRVADGDLVWDWATSSSNYATVRQKKTAESNGYGWEMESSTDVSIAQLQRLVYSSGTGLGTVPADMDYDPVVDKVNPQNSKSADEVRDEDLMTLFGSLSNPRVTRVRADLVRAALGKDLHLTASTDQTTLPGTHQITHDVNRPVCPTYPPCPPCPPTDVEGLGGGGGCSAAADGAPDLGLLFVAGFVGLSIVRRRRRR